MLIEGGALICATETGATRGPCTRGRCAPWDGETLRLVLEGLGDGGAEDDGAAL